MLDIKLIKKDPEYVKKNLERRGMDTCIVDEVLHIYEKKNTAQKDVEQLQRQRNQKTEEMKKKIQANQDSAEERQTVKDINQEIKLRDARRRELQEQYEKLLMSIPNLLHESVPHGNGEAGNVELRTWGTKPQFSFPPRGHEELGIALNGLDIEKAATIAGARFYFLKNELVLLDVALQRFALDFLQEKGFQLMEPPFMIRKKPFSGVTDSEAFEETIYKIEGEDLYLIATSEHPLVSSQMDSVLDPRELPLRLAGISPCFRKEAGAHGKDTKGIFRVHQFNKVEQVVFSHPDESWNIFEELMVNTEEIYQKLNLPYRIVNICTGDIGSIAAKKYDIEVWFPTQSTYREVGSCSQCTDYQARRLRIRYGVEGETARGLVHTLNNTAIATQRTIAAILENNQQEDGSVVIPKTLVPYTGFKSISPQQ